MTIPRAAEVAEYARRSSPLAEFLSELSDSAISSFSNRDRKTLDIYHMVEHCHRQKTKLSEPQRDHSVAGSSLVFALLTARTVFS
jgi:hypothetical protein